MFKKFLEKKGYTVDKFNELEAEKQMELQNEYLGDIESQVGKAATKEEMNEAIKEELKKLSDGQIKEIADDIAAIQESMKSGFNGIVVDEEKLLETIAEKQAEIVSVLKAGSGTVEIMVVPKAPAIMTTNSGTITGMPALLATQLNPLQRIELDIWDIENEVTTFQTDSPVYTYTYAWPKDGNFDFQSEGAVKSQIDFTWKNASAEPLTFAAWEKLTEQAVQDVKGLLSVAKGYLKDRHDYDKALAVVFGNEANDIKGIIDYATPFTAGALAGTVENPNLMDMINAGILSVRNRTNYPGSPRFNPNVTYLNPFDFFIQFTSAKDSQGKPLYPTAQAGVVVIGNTVIKQRFEIQVGKVFVGDLKKIMLSNYLPYTVKIGWVNDDFIRNQFVILGESRFHLFVKELDKAGFLYDDIETIKTAITKPEA